MKRALLLLGIIALLIACSSLRQYSRNGSNYAIGPTTVYVTPPLQSSRIEVMQHDLYKPYIVIHKDPKIMEIIWPSCPQTGEQPEGRAGEWRRVADSLFFTPRIWFRMQSEGVFESRELHPDSVDYSLLDVPQVYLVKKDSIVDITDYSYYLKEFFGEEYECKGSRVFILLQ